jgi:two-component system sensor histidine kinase RegB
MAVTAKNVAAGFPAVDPRGHAGEVRLRTLVLIRWVAVVGQTVALLAVYAGLGFAFPLGVAFVVVTASALLNVALSIRFPPTRRIRDGEASAYLAYDILQLAALLYLTGGLSNPFALLVMVPVTISATILSLRSTVRLAVLALACISLLAVFHLPLPWSDEGLVLDGTYVLGIWSALSLGLLFLAAYAWKVAQEARRMSDALVATQMALSREQRLSSLGGLAARTGDALGDHRLGGQGAQPRPARRQPAGRGCRPIAQSGDPLPGYSATPFDPPGR